MEHYFQIYVILKSNSATFLKHAVSCFCKRFYCSVSFRISSLFITLVRIQQ